MDPIKEAFDKIKEEINILKNDIIDLKSQLQNTQSTPIHTQTPTNQLINIQTTPTHKQSQIPQQTNQQTHNQTTPTHNQHIQPLYNQNNHTSTGNEGVPTDRQTNQQTHQQTENNLNLTIKSDFKEASDILNSLDNIKKGIRLKFKRLTPQEMLVFSVLYSLEEQQIPQITYKTLANEIKLSESSIRDYTNKLINKGVPIEKTRQNNKTIILKISQDLKNIATLATIQSLREI